MPAPAGCLQHEDCPGGLCVFSTGECSIACTPGADDCPQGQTCDGCGTQSCGDCEDCVAVCVAEEPGPCDEHADCPGGLCLFGTGECTSTCSDSEPCADGLICDDCAAASCPFCADCLSGCVPAQAGQCDSADDCAAGSVCVWETHTCEIGCINGNDCADPNAVCVDCATSSCPDCDDCVGICLLPP